MQLDGSDTTLSPVVHGDIALSINTQYNTMLYVTQYDQNIITVLSYCGLLIDLI